MIKPPIHPKIRPGESVIGYLIRLTELNDYPSTTWISEKEIRHSSSRYAGQLDSSLREQSWTSYTTMMRDSLIEGIPGKFLEFDNLKVCPECIKYSNTWDESWHIKPLLSCPIHHVWFIDKCSNCGGAISPLHSLTHSCRCGHQYGDEGLTKASSGVTRVMKFIVGEEDINDQHCFIRSRSISLKDRLELLELFIYVSEFASNFPRGWPVKFKVGDFARELLEQTAANFFSGERAFIKALEGINIPVDITLFAKMKILSFVEKCQPLLSSNESAVRQFLQHLYYRVISIETKSPAITQQRSKLLEDGWTPIEDAANEYRVNLTALKFLIKKGELRSLDFRDADKQRIVCYVLKEDVERCAASIKDLVEIYGAGKILGLQHYRISELAREGLYGSVDTILGHKTNTKYFSRSELLELQSKLLKGLVVQDGIGRPLDAILSGYPKGNFIVTAIRALADGKIASVAPGKNYTKMGSVEVNVDSFRRFYETWQEKDLIQRRTSKTLQQFKSSGVEFDIFGT